MCSNFGVGLVFDLRFRSVGRISFGFVLTSPRFIILRLAPPAAEWAWVQKNKILMSDRGKINAGAELKVLN